MTDEEGRYDSSGREQHNSRWRATAQQAEQRARSVVNRVRPLAHRAAHRVAPVMRRIWLWLTLLMRRVQQRSVLAARHLRSWLAPRVQRAQDKLAPVMRRAQERAAPWVQRIQEKSAPLVRRVQEWASPWVRRVRSRLAPVVAAIRAKLPATSAGTSRHGRVPPRMRSMQVASAVAAVAVLAAVVGNSGTGSEERDTEAAAHKSPLRAPAAAPAPYGAAKKAPTEPAPGARSGPAAPSEAPSEGASEEAGKAIGPDAEGIDVSNHNGNISWKRVAASGKKFAFVLATDGGDFTNPMFQQQYQGAKKEGLLVGAYHFGRPTGSAVDQANRLLDTMGPTDGAKTLPPVLDMEVSPSGGSCYGKTPAQLQDWIRMFSGTVKDRAGEKPILYVSPSFWSSCMGGSQAFADHPLWLASYGVSDPEVPGGWNAYTFWQFTNKGSVPGISGPVDINKFKGSGKALLDLAAE